MKMTSLKKMVNVKSSEIKINKNNISHKNN